ncbi:hypothetical protein LguiB_018995 [Lonicera macranthoides]
MRTAIQSESRVVVVVEECEFSLVGPETIPKEFFQKNTEDQWRSLILIIGDRLPCQVKSAILSTLTIMIRRGGINPFLPWLQTTFVKCLRDNTRMVHSSAALALGKLIAIFYPASDGGVHEAILTTLKGVVLVLGIAFSSSLQVMLVTLSFH